MAIENRDSIPKMEDILKTAIENDVDNKDESEVKLVKNKDKKSFKKKEKLENIPVPRGKPKSGRIWKNEKTRFSSIIKTKGIRNSFEKKQALRESLKRVKEASREIIAARKEENELKKQRRRDNLKRQEENRKKSEVVQVITNTSKIKKMKRKHLRSIEKRDTTNL